MGEHIPRAPQSRAKTDRLISQIGELVKQSPVVALGSVYDDNKSLTEAVKNTEQYIPTYVNFSDGFIIGHNQHGRGMDFANTLYVPSGYGPRFTILPYNVEPRHRHGLSDVDLKGFNAICKQESALDQLGIMLGAMAVEASQDFPHALKS